MIITVKMSPRCPPDEGGWRESGRVPYGLASHLRARLGTCDHLRSGVSQVIASASHISVICMPVANTLFNFQHESEETHGDMGLGTSEKDCNRYMRSFLTETSPQSVRLRHLR